MDKARSRKAVYDKAYNARPIQKVNRAKRNAARAKMIKAGKVRKGDSLDVDHKRPLRSGGTNNPRNLRVVARRVNRAKNGH